MKILATEDLQLANVTCSVTVSIEDEAVRMRVDASGAYYFECSTADWNKIMELSQRLLKQLATFAEEQR